MTKGIMNDHIQKFARDFLKDNLVRCTEGQQHRFKQMYAHGKLDLTIDEVIDSMEDERLDWAMQQVQRTLDKLGVKS